MFVIDKRNEKKICLIFCLFCLFSVCVLHVQSFHCHSIQFQFRNDDAFDFVIHKKLLIF